jgi:hypothetical protein
MRKGKRSFHSFYELLYMPTRLVGMNSRLYRVVLYPFPIGHFFASPTMVNFPPSKLHYYFGIRNFKIMNKTDQRTPVPLGTMADENE